MGWLSGWAKRIKITVDSGDIDTDLSHFPILLYLSSICGIGDAYDMTPVFDEVGANSKRIAVTKADGTTQLYVEIEKWDSVNEKAWLWVSASGWTVESGSDTELYIYYDNSQSDNDTYVGDPDSTPAEAVWDSSFKLVTHMRDDPDTSHVRDSTPNNNDGTKKGVNQPQVVTTGKIDDAQHFELGTSAYVTFNLAAVFPYTFEIWVKIDESRLHGLAQGDGLADLDFWISSSDYPYAYITNTDETRTSLNSAIPVSNTSFYNVVLVCQNGKREIFINGTSGNTDSKTSKSLSLERVGFITAAFIGVADECRLSNSARSDAWIKASYETGRDDLLSYGSEETAVAVAVKPIMRVDRGRHLRSRAFFRPSSRL